MKKRLVSLLLVLALAFTLVPSAFADRNDCGISACTCTGSCSYGTSNYSSSNSTQHTYNIYCRGCGVGGGLVLVESHSFSGNRCTKCGYTKSTGGGGGEEPEEPDVPDFCYHRDTSMRWDGCYWYEYCNDCGSLVDMGESHGATVYDGWEYYNRTQHRRYAYCADCGEGEYEYDRHSTREQYEQYSAGQHRVTEYCDVCGHTVGYASYEDHRFAYGAWGAYNDAQHRRAHYCRYCGYTTYDYAGHSFSYSAWQDYDESRHRRTKSCAACGLSNYEYADHADTNGDGKCDGCSKELTVYVDVTLDACGGVLADDEVTVIFGDTYGELPEPTREGYEFDGWYTEKDGGELVEAGTEVSDKAAHTLYAHWTLTKVFSVTVPAGLPLAVTEDGVVTSSTDAAIANNSTCDVRVTAISLKTENGWTLVPFEYNMAAAKVDSKLIGFAIGGAQSVNGGDSESLALTGDWNIDAGSTLPLDYDANVSATSVGIDEQVLTVVFVVEET